MDAFDIIKNKFILKDAYSDWEEFRNAFTDIICDKTAKFRKKKKLSIAILGAGRCNDIDIIRLSGFYEKIVLIDWDEQALMEASEKYAGLVETINFSLTGITEQNVKQFMETVMSGLNKNSSKMSPQLFGTVMSLGLNTLLLNLMKGYTVTGEKLGENKYDMVIANGVHSQLFAMISFFARSVAYSVKSQFGIDTDKSLAEIEAKLSEFNSIVGLYINEAILRSARLCSIFGNEAPYGDNIEGAYQCIHHIRSKNDVVKISETELEWTFNKKENIIYNMLIQICTPLPKSRKKTKG